MRAYVGVGRRVGPLRLGVGLGRHVSLGGLFAWLAVVGVAELAFVALELTARLLKVAVVAVWRLADWAVKTVRAHRRMVAERVSGSEPVGGVR
jgi:hypothetical protein